MNMKTAVIIASGGMDSTTLVYDVVDSMRFDHVVLLSFNYGQRHIKELDYAKRTADNLGLVHKIVDLTVLNEFLQGSALTSPDIPVPEGHYEDESMKSTVVPNRNMIMLSIATGYAVSLGARDVFYGAHAGDGAIYPDCRPEFVDAVNDVTRDANYIPVEIHAPYLHLQKSGIAVRGKELGVPYEDSWTCYNGRDKACGKCGACQERREACEFAGIEDPLEYEDV